MTRAARVQAGAPMRWIPGGRFRMGSDAFYPEERPVREVRVDGFWMDEHPVTNALFRRFVQETGYRTGRSVPLTPGSFRAARRSCSSRGRWCFSRPRAPFP